MIELKKNKRLLKNKGIQDSNTIFLLQFSLLRILFPNTPEKRKIIVHAIRKKPIRTTVIQLSSTGIFDNNAIHANSFVNANGRSIRTYFQTVVICGEPIPLCVYTSGIHTHTHKQVSSCKTSETRLSFFLLQFRHVDLHGHANSIRHETPRGNGLGASGSRHKVTTDRFLVDYFKSKLRRSLIPRARNGVALPPADFLLSKHRVSGYFCTGISARSRRSQLAPRGISAGNSASTVLSSRVSGNGNDRRQFERVIVYARREFEAAWLLNEMLSLNGKSLEGVLEPEKRFLFSFYFILGIIFVVSFVFWRTKGK